MLTSFTHRCVRDLAWVIASPPLVSGVFNNNGHCTKWWNHTKCLQEFKDCLPALQHLDKTPKPLITYLEGIKSKRLGLYFETLISFWLDFISPNFKLLAQNIQLNEIAGDTRSRTVGEVDFIIQELLSEKVIHLEVAVKFYLGTEPFHDAYRWFGTNIKDQLGNKVDHLQQHQTQLLLHHPKQIPFIIDERHCLLKGRLFYPLAITSSQYQQITPNYVANHHLRGRYVFYNKEKPSSQQLVQLKKSEWFATLSHQDIAEKNIVPTFIAEKRASCYAILKVNKKGKIKELERMFCLPQAFSFSQR